MSQKTLGTINPATESGSALASDLTDFGAAAETSHSGATPPSYAKVGTPYLDTSVTPPQLKMCYNATGPLLMTIAELKANVSSRCNHSGGRAPASATDGTDTTPVVTEFYICEIQIPHAVSVTGLALLNGSAVAGNIKVGLADSGGTVIASSASTAQSGTAGYQRVAFAGGPFILPPGTYYALAFFDNTGARFRSHAFGNFGADKKTGQTFSTGFTTITAPTTFSANPGPIMSGY